MKRSHEVWHPLTMILMTLALALACGDAQAKTLVFPHALERTGTITSTQNTFDTQFFMTYGAAGGGATVHLYLYDSATSQPLRSNTGQVVCNPCTYPLGLPGTPRKRTVLLEDEIVAKGGFPQGRPQLEPFVVVVVDGDDNGVAVRQEIRYAQTQPFDLSVFSNDGGTPECPGTLRSYLVPHLLEIRGSISNTQFTVDNSIIATLTSGLTGAAPCDPNSACGCCSSVSLYLYDDSGATMKGSAGTEVCNPCTFDLTATSRKQTFRIDDLIVTRGGGFDQNVKLGFGVIVVGGANPDGVNLQGFVVNSHTSPFDLSVFGFEPQPIEAAALVGVPDRVGAVGTLRASPNPTRAGMEFHFDLARASRVELSVFDVRGRNVGTVFSGQRAAGSHTLTWNGRGVDGAPLASGVYYGRLNGDDGSLITRVVFVR